jgi:hypothetical protein
MDQRMLVASLFIWSACSKCPLLNMPTKLKAMPSNGREWTSLFPIEPAAQRYQRVPAAIERGRVSSMLFHWFIPEQRAKSKGLDVVVPQNKNLMTVLTVSFSSTKFDTADLRAIAIQKQVMCSTQSSSRIEGYLYKVKSKFIIFTFESMHSAIIYIYLKILWYRFVSSSNVQSCRLNMSYSFGR